MKRNILTRRLAAFMALCFYCAFVVCPVAMAEQTVQQSTANQNLITGPVLNPGDGKSGVTGLLQTAVVVATGGTTTTITTNTSQVAGQKVVWGASTTTAALRGLSYTISSVSGSSAPYTLTMPTMAAAPVSGDTYVVYNFATGGSSTTVTSAQSATLGQWLTFPATTATGSLQGVSAWVTGISGSGPYTITVTPALPATPTSSDFFGLSQVAWTISKNGGGYVVPTGLISEPGNGYYTLAANATDDNTLGRTLVHWAQITANTADPGETPLMIVAYNPLSGTNLGLSALPTANPAASNGLLTVGTSSGQLNPSGGVLPGLTTALTGTATAGGASTITLAAGPSTDDQIKGDYVAILSGTGSGQARTITAYNHTTLVATASRSWAVNPDATSVYAVIMNPHPALDANLAVTTGTNSDKNGYGVSSIVSGVAAADVWNALTASYTVTNSMGLAQGSTLTQATNGAASAATAVTQTTAANLAAGVLNATASSYNTASTIGNKINAAGTASDPWATPLPGSYSAGQAGNIIGNRLDAAVSTRLATSGYTAAPTTAQIAAAILANPSNLLATDSSGSPVLSTAVQNALRDIIWAKVIDGSLNAQDALVLDIASIAGVGANSFNSGTHVNTATHKRQDGTTTAYSTATQYGSSQTALPATGSTTTITTPLH